MSQWALTIQPKIAEISVGTSNLMERTISVWSDQNIRDLLWRWSSLTGLVISDGRFHLSPVPLFSSLLTIAYKNNNQTRGGLGRVFATGMYRSTGRVEFPKFQTVTGSFLNGKRPIFRISRIGGYSDKAKPK